MFSRITQQTTLSVVLGVMIGVGPTLAGDRNNPDTDKAQKQAQTQRGQDPGPERSWEGNDVLKQKAPGAFSMKHELERATDLIGMNVRDAAGVIAGEIEDAVIHAESGRIAYVAIRYDQTLGFGGELAAAPPEALTRTEDGEAVRLPINNETLNDAPRLKEGDWADASDEQWCEQLYAFYNVDTCPMSGKQADARHADKKHAEKKHAKADKDRARHADKQARMHEKSGATYRLSQMPGLDLKTVEKGVSGEIDDVIVDVSAHRAMFVIVSYGGTAGINQEQAVAPFTALEFKRQTEGEGLASARLQATQAQLGANRFKADNLDALTDADRARKIFDSYGQTPFWETYGYGEHRMHEDKSHKGHKDKDHSKHEKSKTGDKQ